MENQEIQIYMYTRQDKNVDPDLVSALENLKAEFPNKLNSITIDDDKFLSTQFKDKVPVMDIGPYRLTHPISREEIRFALSETYKKIQVANERDSKLIIERFTKIPTISRSDRFSHWFSKHYMLLFNLAVFIYMAFAFMAPVFMKAGFTKAANVIYMVYKPLCHQLAFRSFFLFGEQIAYPREAAHVEGLLTYGDVSGLDENDIIAARDFNGNEETGYKVALCERDIAIYIAILLFGIVFSLSRRNIPPVPWYVWLIFGIVPIGLDGFSQLLSQTGYAFFNWLPYRESTPLLRTITGGLFGLFTAWFGYPYVEETVAENRNQLENKYAIIRHLAGKKRT